VPLKATDELLAHAGQRPARRARAPKGMRAFKPLPPAPECRMHRPSGGSLASAPHSSITL